MKISRNKARDEEVNLVLAEQGWTVMRFWDFELKADIAACVERVSQVVRPAVGAREASLAVPRER
jgi:DNA mismatch endonuclease (patch repair protein)